jgi:hypothetical protein
VSSAYTMPTALFVAEDTVYGKVFHPANQIAKDICAIAGLAKMPEDRMPYIRRFFQVLAPNGQPLPHPRAYQKPQPEAMQVQVEA